MTRIVSFSSIFPGVALAALALVSCGDTTRHPKALSGPSLRRDAGSAESDAAWVEDAAPALEAGAMGDAAARAEDAAALPDAGPQALDGDVRGPDSVVVSPVPDAAPVSPPDAAVPPPLDAAAPPPQGICGNGAVEPGETCDDDNRVDGDYCAANCLSVTGRCGDGVRQNNENCDDGILVAGCDVTHDGGDGVCVPAGQCSAGFELDARGDCQPFNDTPGVDIFVDNFCNMDVVPPSIHAPPGQLIHITWHNRSVDYPVDVWMSYGGGFLDLEPGTSWTDPAGLCFGGGRPYEAGADISTACSRFQFVAYCD